MTQKKTVVCYEQVTFINDRFDNEYIFLGYFSIGQHILRLSCQNPSRL